MPRPGTKVPSRAEQPLTKRMRLERRPEKTPVGKNVQEIWVGTKASKPILRRLYKNEIRTADPTRLMVLKKKELDKGKNEF